MYVNYNEKTYMKKFDLISFVAIIACAIGLVLLKVTGLTGHIVISVVALAIMVACVVLGKKDWKNPKLEIAYRAFYLVALVTGAVMVATKTAGVVAIVHKAAWAIFAVLFVVNFIKK